MTATIKCTLAVILSSIVLFAGVVTPSPYNGYYVDIVAKEEGGYGFPRYRPVVMLQGSRGFWDFLGNWIQDSSWFPIEINIPDTFGSITSGISNFASGIVQRIPFLNNNNNGSKPFMLLLPMFRSTTRASILHENSTKESTEANYNQETDTYTTQQPKQENGKIASIEENFEDEDNLKTSASTELTLDSNVEVTTIILNEIDPVTLEISKDIDDPNDMVLTQENEEGSLVNYRNFKQNDNVDVKSSNGYFGKVIEVDGEIGKILDEDGFWSYF